MVLRTFKETPTRIPSGRLRRLHKIIWDREANAFHSGEVSVIFTSDDRMRELNRTFRQIDRPTDVLSFCLDDGMESDAFHGEIYISVPIARRQADDYGATLTQEFLRLTCHGLLHLLGYLHDHPEAERLMKAREKHYLDEVNQA